MGLGKFLGRLIAGRVIVEEQTGWVALRAVVIVAADLASTSPSRFIASLNSNLEQSAAWHQVRKGCDGCLIPYSCDEQYVLIYGVFHRI